MDTVKSGAGWAQEKASDLVDSVKQSKVTEKVSDAASSAMDWAKDKVGLGDQDQS
jgi:hypothetical protein